MGIAVGPSCLKRVRGPVSNKGPEASSHSRVLVGIGEDRRRYRSPGQRYQDLEKSTRVNKETRAWFELLFTAS